MLHYPYILAGYTRPETACTTLPGNPHHTESSYTREAAPGKIIGGSLTFFIYTNLCLSHHFDSLHRTVGHDGTYHIDTASQRRNIEAIDIPVQYQCPRKVINRKHCSFGSI